MTRLTRTHVVRACLCGLALLAFPNSASAIDWGLKLDPGMAAAVDKPQSRLFGPGGTVSLKALLGLGRYADVQAGVTFVGLSARAGAPSNDPGVAWGYGVGLRLKRPRDLALSYSPWIDADLMYVRTGDLNRLGFSVGAGVAMALDTNRRLWLGPFIRYFQVVQTVRTGFDNADAKILLVGASLEIGSAHRRPVARPIECPTCATDAVTDRDGDGVRDGIDKCPDQPGPAATYGCPDRDGDGLADLADVCPDAPGPISNRGCPLYQKVIVKPNKLELKEKILFSWDKAIIEPQSYPLLDEVVQALRDNRSFNVRIEGHADSTGAETHNQTLSEERARAVLDYLAQKGIAPARLSFKGFSSSQPIDNNQTLTGREANRRVEFVVELLIVNEGNTK